MAVRNNVDLGLQDPAQEFDNEISATSPALQESSAEGLLGKQLLWQRKWLFWTVLVVVVLMYTLFSTLCLAHTFLEC
ncbi:MAG: hypothetical protein MI749_04230 [Desulfovibrionales bacterium]|nr:hypothetical protein [Desulfovibrionales bacterium]